MHFSAHTYTSDIPGTEYRAATISGPPDACQRAKKMVEDIVAEVGERDNMKAMFTPPSLAAFYNYSLYI